MSYVTSDFEHFLRGTSQSRPSSSAVLAQACEWARSTLWRRGCGGRGVATGRRGRRRKWSPRGRPSGRGRGNYYFGPRSKDGRTADPERGDNAEDTPRDAGFAGAVAAKHDAETDADHGQIPDEREEQAEGSGRGVSRTKAMVPMVTKSAPADSVQRGVFSSGPTSSRFVTVVRMGASVEGEVELYF